MNNLQKIGGVAALLEAIIYVSAFVFFGAFWDFPSGAGIEQKLVFMKENQVIFTIVNFIMYVGFGIVLAVLVLALHERLRSNADIFSKMAVIFGVIWVGLVIMSGMIANIGIETVVVLSATEPEQAWSVWLAIASIVEGLGGGNEIVGGLWVLLLSIAALTGNNLSKKLNYLGLFVGLAGILTVYPADILTEIFGLSQIVWFSWLGLLMLQEPLKLTNSSGNEVVTNAI
ncbi:hypothetical protein A9Q74_02540 [Colwellia sp. 39_35_sub15_T18]|nr:hypothetical protein A9Q74_02540 [Colwellia sp. 39_35_sub15_T18]